jgi:MtrB/PioB family decaheme-associated outer membrane protein
MLIKSTVQALLISSLAVMASTAMSNEPVQDKERGEITLGVAKLTSSDESKYLSHGSGMSDDTTYIWGGYNFLKQWDRQYLETNGKLYGPKTRQIDISLGSYDEYDITFKHQRQSRLQSTVAKTPFAGVDGDDLKLPTFGSQFTTTGAMPLSSSHNIDLGTDRSIAELQLTLRPMTTWRLDFTVKQDLKVGTKALGGVVGINTARTASTILPAPVDYRTDEIGFSVGYEGELYQVQLGYHLSQFFNDDKALKWANPFLRAAGGPFPRPAYPTDGQLSLAPDNEHHRLSLQGGINLPMASQLNMLVEYGQMKQNDTLLPYTINSGSTVDTALPRTSAEAEIDTLHLMLNLSSRPIPKLALNAKYRFYDNRNNTPHDLFQRVSNDTGDQVADSSNLAVYNLDYDYTQQQLNLDGRYYFGQGTSLKLGVERDIWQRDHRAVEKTTEDTLSVKLKSRFGRIASGSVSYAHAERRGDDYDPNRVYLDMHSEAFINSQLPLDNADGDFDNNPLLTQSDIADKDRDSYALAVNIIPANGWMVSLYGQNRADDYTNTQLGLTASEMQSLTFDVSYSSEYGDRFYAYLSQEEVAQSVEGRSFSPFSPGGTWGSAQDSANNWQADIDDHVDTFGTGAHFDLTGTRITLDLRYSYSLGNSEIGVSDSGLTAVAIPDSESDTHRVRLEGTYNYSRQWLFSLGAQYEKYDAKNWQRDGIDAASGDVDYLLLLQGSEPDYEAYILYLGSRYSWY